MFTRPQDYTVATVELHIGFYVTYYKSLNFTKCYLKFLLLMIFKLIIIDSWFTNCL